MRKEPKSFAFPKILKNVIVAAITLFLVKEVLLGVFFMAEFTKKLTPKTDIDSYLSVEVEISDKSARKWLDYIFFLIRTSELKESEIAETIAVALSVYDDVYNLTDDEVQAGLAVASLMKKITPEGRHVLDRENFLQAGIDSKTRDILELYYLKIDNNNEKQHWILSGADNFAIPVLGTGNLFDELEILKTKFAVKHRNTENLGATYFWLGNHGADKDIYGRSVGLSSLWQNVFYAEVGENLEVTKFNKYQKILAQSIADAYRVVYSLNEKGLYKAPYERIPSLDVLGSYRSTGSISPGATVSYAAASILSNYFPEKEEVWFNTAENVASQELASGLNFEQSIKAGKGLGLKIGSEILSNLGEEPKLYKRSSSFIKPTVIGQWLSLKVQDIFLSTGNWFQRVSSNKSKFQDKTTKFNIKYYDSLSGISWHDYNNDTNLDLLLVGAREGVRLFRAEENGFRDVTEESGLNLELLRSVNSGVFGDYNNDGCPDIYFTRVETGTAIGPDSLGDRLFKNNCNGTFNDVTRESGIVNLAWSEGASWADFNRDGYLDIYVANYRSRPGPGMYANKNILFKNNGDGTFEDITVSAGVEGFSNCAGVTFEGNHNTFALNNDGKLIMLSGKRSFQPMWFDYNNDMWPDLFVSTDQSYSPLYKNNGDGTFEDVTEEAGLCRYGTNMGVAVGDYDNDGWLDLYTTNVGLNYLWHNMGGGTFSEVSSEKGTSFADGFDWGTLFLDYDNDGWLDLHVSDAGQELFPGSPKSPSDKLFKNVGGSFIDISESSGLSGNKLELKFASAAADYNNDGFVDIFSGLRVPSGGQKPRYQGYIFENPGGNNNFLSLKLIGTESNRDAVGARITIKANGMSQTREISAGDSFHSQSSPWPIFGLGRLESADFVEIKWPSGKETILENVPGGQILTVIEE